MAREPDIVLIRLNELRDDVRALRDEVGAQSRKIDAMDSQIEQMRNELTYALGLGTRSIIKNREQDNRLDELMAKYNELIPEGQP